MFLLKIRTLRGLAVATDPLRDLVVRPPLNHEEHEGRLLTEEREVSFVKDQNSSRPCRCHDPLRELRGATAPEPRRARRTAPDGRTRSIFLLKIRTLRGLAVATIRFATFAFDRA